MLKEYKLKNIYQGRLDKGVDIIGGLIQVMKEKSITAGVISGIGAVSEAHIGYFNSQTKKYEEVRLQENMEILSLRGNISLKEGSVFPHLHVVLSKKDFSALGGHLYPGTTAYAFEFEIVSMEGDPFVRRFDDDTGLFLWKD